MRKFTLRLAAVCFLLVVLLVAAGVIAIIQYSHTPLAITGETVLYEVEPGSSLNKVARELAKKNYLSCPRCLVFIARVTARSDIRAGEYELPKGITPSALLSKLNSGEVLQRQVTLVEGRSFRDALENLRRAPKLKLQLKGLSEEQIRQKLGIPEKHLEGQFFPDSYAYTTGSSDMEILNQAYNRMQQVLQEEWANRAEGLPYRTAYDALIMASIVEKETGAAEERAAIAGVFVRRLQKGMKLQTDPTVIYGLGDAYKGNLTRKHLVTDTPWNTYTRYGLPPTPIALPGREAIHAALHPEEGDALYFVGKGDGRHYFSATLAEHEKAVRQYQLTRKKDYHSAPEHHSTTKP